MLEIVVKMTLLHIFPILALLECFFNFISLTPIAIANQFTNIKKTKKVKDS